EKYFVIKGDKYYIKPIIKKMVEFRYLDLIGSPYLEDVDMIICRNVFIYFTKALQEQIVDKFYHSLKEGGYLIIGKSETLVFEARLIFKEIDMYNRIYQKLAIK
ncbi:MAG: protein-glutamate O-methyltransferase CheR, partial [Candidatus Omnitrophica bacterium]|nr:protein-glutamate O-methyltransferase CheR [Candidatus Omnitrophota bacterium]